MADDHKSEEKTQWLRPDDDARRRIDELIRDAEEAVLNTKRFLEGIQESNPSAREQVLLIRDRFEKNLRFLQRSRQKEEDQL